MAGTVDRELPWLFRHTRPYLRLQLASILCITASSWLYLIDPLVMKWLLDHVLPRRSLRDLLIALLLIFGCYAGRVLLSAVGNLVTVEASQKIVLSLRKRLLRHMDTLSPSYHGTLPMGARFYLFREPMDEIGQLGADLLPALFRTIILTLSVVTAMALLNHRLTLFVIPVIPVFLFITGTYRRRLQSCADSFQRAQATQSADLQEHLAGITQLQLLTAERYQERRLFHQFAEVVRALCSWWRSSTQFTIASNSIILAGTVAVLGLGGWEFFQGRLTIGGLVAFYTYLTRLFEPLSGAIELYSRLQRVGASVRKVMGALEERPSVREAPFAIPMEREARPEIQFDNVHFSYDGQGPVLCGVSFQIRPGSRVAFVGPNGSGKSTTGKLMARLHDPNVGTVQLDGTDIRDIQLQSVRKSVAYLPQDAVLFWGTLRENLLLGNLAVTETDLAWAIELTELQGVVSRIPGGLSGCVGPDGVHLSSGQRQRVALARAALRRPAVMILDEATSLIERDAEQRVLSRLNDAMPSTTLVVISHHLSALACAEQIFVLHQGTLLEKGSLAELSRRSTLFRQLFQPQAAGNSYRHPDGLRNNGEIHSPQPIASTRYP